MTSIILFFVGIGLIFSSHIVPLGIVVLMCSAEVANKQRLISKLKAEVARLRLIKHSQGEENES